MNQFAEPGDLLMITALIHVLVIPLSDSKRDSRSNAELELRPTMSCLNLSFMSSRVKIKKCYTERKADDIVLRSSEVS